MQYTANMIEQHDRAAHAFIEKMKTRDMRVPILEDFKREEVDFDVELVANLIAEKDLGLDFLLDSMLVLYEFQETKKIEALAKRMISEPFASMEADNATKLKIMTIISSVLLTLAIRRTVDKDRETLFTDLRKFFQRADKIKVSEKSTLALKGFYYFFSNEIQQSTGYFENARTADKVQFIPAIIGRGCLEFARKKYNEARDLFREAIKANPNGPYQELELAKLGYESVLRRNPQCYEAIVGLAVIARRQNNFTEYYERLEAVFRAQPFHYLANIYLAEHYFYRKDFERAKKLIEAGLKRIDEKILLTNPEKKDTRLRIDMCTIKSKYLYMKGFIAHDTEPKLDLAAQLYKQAVEVNPENTPALFGLAQIHLSRQSFDESISCFEAIAKLKAEAEASDCFRIMAYIYGKLDRRELAKKYYELALKYHPHDVELLIEYATYVDTLDVKEGLKNYKKAIAIYDSNPDTMKPRAELFNNYGVTLIKDRQFDEADAYFTRAQRQNAGEDQATDTFIRFNKAYLLEQRGRSEEAEQMYVELVKANPLFPDPMYRLAAIHHSKGDVATAIAILDQACEVLLSLKTFHKIDIAFCQKSSYLIEELEYEEAIRNIKKLEDGLPPQKDGKHAIDPYGSLLAAQSYYLISVHQRNKIQDQKSNLQRVAAIAKDVLSRKKDSTNMYAAMATAAVLAERSGFKQATEILQMCQESSPNNPKVQYNLALLEYLKGSYERSFTILSSYMNKNLGVINEQVMILYAMSNLRLKSPKEALRQFQKLMFMYPNRHEYLFNLGVFMHDFVMDSFKQSKRDLQMIETTQSYLKLSKKYLEWLLTTLNTLYGEKLRYPEHYSDEKKTRQLHRFQQMMKVTNESLFYLNQNHKSFENRIEEDKKQYEVEHKTVQEHRRVKAGQEAHKQEEIEREELQRLAREKELEDKARYHQELATKLQLEIANEKKLKELQANKKGSKRRKEYEENENGQLATLNFGKHADDNEQEQDGDFSLRVSYPKAELPERRAAAPKKKSARTNGNGQAGTANDEPAGRGEGRSRLKKQKAAATNKDDSDELLEVDDDSDSDDKHDALPPLDDDDDEPRAKPKRKPKADNDGDIEPDQLNFGGRDEGENEF